MDALIETHPEAILRLVSERGARNVRVFGSRARGEAGPESDVDLLVEMDVSFSLLDQVSLEHALEDLLGCEVDLVAEDEVRPQLNRQILAEAVAL